MCGLFELSDQPPYKRQQAKRTPDEIKDAALNYYFNNLNESLEQISAKFNTTTTTLSNWLTAYFKSKRTQDASVPRNTSGGGNYYFQDKRS